MGVFDRLAFSAIQIIFDRITSSTHTSVKLDLLTHCFEF